MQYEGNVLRHEKKYYIPYDSCHILRERLQTVMTKDPHMEEKEGYLITSLYLDDRYHAAAEDKKAGIRCRKKYRIRCYERNASRIRLECKSKYGEFIAKEGTELSREEYTKILDQDTTFLLHRSEDLCRRLYGNMQAKLLRPVVAVEYRREAYVSPWGNVRITFDKDISASAQWDMFSEGFAVRRVLPENLLVLEVKYDDYLPGYIRTALQGICANSCAVSKYVMCREEKRRVDFL